MSIDSIFRGVAAAPADAEIRIETRLIDQKTARGRGPDV
jgi:hypothetical protein